MAVTAANLVDPRRGELTAARDRGGRRAGAQPGRCTTMRRMAAARRASGRRDAQHAHHAFQRAALFRAVQIGEDPGVIVLRMVEERFHRDAEGRPIREGRTPPELLGPGEIEYRQCPYAGSRHLNERPMNVSALRQTSAHWDEVIDATALLRAAYSDARGGYRGDVMDIWRVSQLGSALPWFYILGLGAACPAYAAALSKATLGVGIWGHRMFVKMLADRSVIPRFTSQLMLDTAEETGTLIAEHEVCAASDRMMLRLFDVFTGERPAVTGAGEVARLVAERDEMLRFGAHYVAFKQWIWLYWIARRHLYLDLASVLGALPVLAELMDPSGEPPDFFPLEPEDVPGLALEHRGLWFRGLANLVEPFSPDGSDAPLRELAARLAAVMGAVPPRSAELAAEVARVTGAAPAGAARIGRAVGMYLALDDLLGDVLAAVERGLRGAPAAVFDAEMRDRVLRAPPRALFAGLAPALFGELARP
jgi:hypothetical protein